MVQISQYKRCSRCKQLKTLDKYSINRARVDGLQIVCKQCQKEYMGDYKKRIKVEPKIIRKIVAVYPETKQCDLLFTDESGTELARIENVPYS